MSENSENKVLWFNFLKAFTRSLVQINLYKPDHPQVKQALEEGQALLAQIAGTLGGEDFSLTMDNDKLLVNGVPLLTADKLPNSLKNLFTKFRIQTISFSSGVTGEDLLALCQVQAFKGEAKEFLKERGVDRIKLNEAIYTKVGGAQPEGAGGTGAGGSGAGAGDAGPGPGAGGAGGAAAADERMTEKIADQGLETALCTVVARVTADPEEQKRIIAMLGEKIKQEIEASVNKALEGIRLEKKKVENDMVRTESVMTSMADGVVVVDKDGKILMMNPQAEAISGKPLSELSGKRIVDLSQIENQVVSLAREIKSENKADISQEIQKTGPAELAETVKKATAIIQNEDGKIVGSVSVPTDAVKLKQVEKLQQQYVPFCFLFS